MEVTKDSNGIDQVVLRNPRGAYVRVSLRGGQIISWRNEKGEQLLYRKIKGIIQPPKALQGVIPFCLLQVIWLYGSGLCGIFKCAKSIEGGISICFPQFENCGSGERNGFARNKIWTIDENAPPLDPKYSQGKSFVDLLLKPSDEDLKCWPHRFEFRLRVSLAKDGKLNLISRIRNVDGKPFSFSFAYHTYLAVSDISDARIEGLETRDYLDNLIKRKRFTDQGDAITFESELDRVYLKTPKNVAIFDHLRRRTFLITKEGLPDVVVWNPWETKILKWLRDFGSSAEYKRMICVNAAAVNKPITLMSGYEWKGSLELSAVPSSFL